MSYFLQPLLRIRVMREDRAAGELTVARRAVAEAERKLEERKNELAEYERRERIYDAIIGRPVSRDRIDIANEGVARIDEEGVLKADNVTRAEGELKDREAAAESARVNFAVAMKNRMKIEEHKSVWMEDESDEQERRAEGELEDFIVRKPEI